MRQAMSLQQVYSDRSPKTEFCGRAIAEERSQNLAGFLAHCGMSVLNSRV